MKTDARPFYESCLPNCEPLTAEKSAALLVELARIKNEIFEGHVGLIRKCVWTHLELSHRRDAEWGSHLESIAIEAFWLALQRVKPQGPEYFPYEFFRQEIVGELAKEEREATKHKHVSLDTIEEVLVVKDGVGSLIFDDGDEKKLGRQYNELRQHLATLAVTFPSKWHVDDIIMAKYQGTSWKDIADVLGVSVRTCRDRYKRGMAELKKLFGVEPQK